MNRVTDWIQTAPQGVRLEPNPKRRPAAGRSPRVILALMMLAAMAVAGPWPGRAADAAPPWLSLPAYALTDLGTTLEFKTALNDLGEVVGYSVALFRSTEGLPPVFHALLYRGGKLIDLNALMGPSVEGSEAQAINLAGHVVGSVTHPIGSPVGPEGFLYAGGKVQLFSVPGSTETYATGINNFDQLVGYFSGADGLSHGFLRQPNGRFSDLGTFGGIDALPAAINDLGQLVGYFTTSDGASHAFLTQPEGTAAKDLGSLGGGDAAATAVNDLGQVVGWSFVAGLYHAFLYAEGKLSDLGTLPGGSYSLASGINLFGQIVGYADVPGGLVHGFVYSQGKMGDLNGLLNSAAQGWTIYEALGINDRGQILADAAFHNGSPHAVILTPNDW